MGGISGVDNNNSINDNLVVSDNTPRPLDNFRRGYSERTNLRERALGGLIDVDRDKKRQKNGKQNKSNTNRRRKDKNNDNSINRIVVILTLPNADIHTALNNALKWKGFNNETFFSGNTTPRDVGNILSRLTRMRKTSVALAVWKWAQSTIPENIRINVNSYNGLLDVYAELKDWKKTSELMEEMDRLNVRGNAKTYSLAISTCEKGRNHHLALKLLDQMRRQYKNNKSRGYNNNINTTRSDSVYNSVISACENCITPDLAMGVFEMMKEDGVRPTVITYSALISAHEKVRLFL